MSWTQYTPHQNIPVAQESRSDAPSLHPTADIIDPPLEVIETKSIEKINSLSISEFAPALNEVQHRFPFAPLAAIVALIIVGFAFRSGSQNIIALSAIYAVLGIPLAIYLDRYRRSIKIKYELEGTAKVIATTLAETFGDLQKCSSIWNIHAQGRTSDWKRNAGATQIKDRKRLYLCLAKPRCIRGAVSFPAVRTNAQELYFLPDAALIIKEKSVAALTYQELAQSENTVRFIEEDSVPHDASVVGQTWRK